MELIKKIDALKKIYAVYDDFSATLEVACQKNCAHCCTSNVTLTTLEAYHIVEHRDCGNDTEFIGKIQQASALKRYQPDLTTNRLAELCARGMDPPEEKRYESWEPCPVLTDNQCPFYAIRPFGCRCFLSRQNCGQSGYADIDDFVISVNTVFLQTIEHIDARGCTGNLFDVLRLMVSEKNRGAYEKNSLNCRNNELIPNQPLKVLMIPPEHRSRLEPILKALRKIKI